LFFTLISLTQAYAQQFYAGAIGGLVLSQIDGDSYGGYHKFAGSGGLYVRNNFGEKWGYRMELKYIQKGSKAARLDMGYHTIPFYKASLNYIEIPFLFSYRMQKFKIPPTIDWQLDGKLHLNIGMNLSYLFSATEDDGTGPNEAGFAFRRIELGAQTGVTYYFSPHWAFDFRFCYTIIPIRDRPNASDLDYWVTYEFNRVLLFSIMYEI